jgi:4-amino-4-deoxy-L-arabinose transferase-like glycosyltransferase
VYALRWTAVLLLAVGLLVGWSLRIDGAPVEKDAGQNVQMALNVERHGVMSLEEAPPYVPTNYREPLPIFASAAAIELIDARLGPAPDQEYFHGERVRLLKYQNIVWLALLSLGAFWAIRLLSSSSYLALLGVLIVNLPFLHSHTALDDLYTELPAAALLMLASLSLARTVRNSTFGSALTTGVLFGLTILTKASILYVFVGAALVVAAVFVAQRRHSLAGSAARLLVMFVGIGCVITPWIFRNHVELGTYHISQRAGVVLMQRAEYDLMSAVEIEGSFYVWANPEIQRPLGRLLGFSPADLRRHGRLQHLNEWDSDFSADDLAAEQAGMPEKTLTYYREARAERVKLSALMRKAGKPEPEIAADDAVEQDALQIIEHHPWHHLLLTISLILRGASSLILVSFVLTLWISVRRRDWDLLAFVITAAGAVVFYALFSEFIGRYALPMRPIAVVAVLVALYRTFYPQIAQRASMLFRPAPQSAGS